MFTILSVIYTLVCLFLIFVVLLQAGKGGGMGAAFGGSTQTVFGGAGAGNFLTRLTVVCAALFMILSATLAYLSSSRDPERSLERAGHALRVREKMQKVGNTPTKTKAAGASDMSLVSDPAAVDAAVVDRPVDAGSPPPS